LTRKPLGKVVFIGVGQDVASMTVEATKAIKSSAVIAGPSPFVKQVVPLLSRKTRIINDDTSLKTSFDQDELRIKRLREIVRRVKKGDTVAVLSGGDPGVYGSADFYLESLLGMGIHFELIPGVTSFLSAASKLGTPIFDDFALVALCDNYTPWRTTRARLLHAAQSDLITILYKPRFDTEVYPWLYPRRKYPDFFPSEKKSHTRFSSLASIFLQYRNPKTPVAIVNNVRSQFRPGHPALVTDRQDVIYTPLDKLESLFDMVKYFAVVFIGASTTKLVGRTMVTRRWLRRFPHLNYVETHMRANRRTSNKSVKEDGS
jgi:precorrin-3B C17-methyltransferase